RFPRGWEPTEDGKLNPQLILEHLSREIGPEAIYVAGVGQHQMWAAQFIDFENPRTWINSGGAGTMGYAVPAALGAKAGLPDKEVWAIDGDGCFQMTNQELTTAAVEGFPIKRSEERRVGKECGWARTGWWVVSRARRGARE